MPDIELQIKNAIVRIRGMPVILAIDLARFFETETKFVNLYRNRNMDKFTEDYAFQLSETEWEGLKLQNATSKKGRGGTRHPPWAYTEHGVAMMSMGSGCVKTAWAMRRFQWI